MAKVTPKNLKPIHTRAARALLEWDNTDLAEAAGLSPSYIRKFESTEYASEKARQAIIDAIETNGVQLLNGGRAGARLKAKPK